MAVRNRSVLIMPSPKEVVHKLCSLIEEIANGAIQSNKCFTIGLSGGSLVKFLAEGLNNIETDWSKWVFFFCDERVVPVDSPDSTFGEYKRNVIANIPIKESQFVQISPGLNAEEAAKDYTKKIEAYFPPPSMPKFDLLLLGVGEDGHTCSLFPGHPLLSEENVWVAPITDSPKPPPSRITLTLPVINNSRNCIFAMAGAGKAHIVDLILNKDKLLPANLVNPSSGKVFWILDETAGSLVDEPSAH